MDWAGIIRKLKCEENAGSTGIFFVVYYCFLEKSGGKLKEKVHFWEKR